MKKAAAIFSLITGLAMTALWIMLLCTGQIPELKTEPFRIWLHVASETLTAGAFLVSAFALLTGRSWAKNAFLIASGMVIYSVINAAGYYIQLHKPEMAVMFAVILAADVIIVAGLMRDY